MSNDTSVFPVAILENAVTRPIAYQGEEASGLPHWNQRSEVSRFRRRSAPSNVSLQKSRGSKCHLEPELNLSRRCHGLEDTSCVRSWNGVPARITAEENLITISTAAVFTGTLSFGRLKRLKRSAR